MLACCGRLLFDILVCGRCSGRLSQRILILVFDEILVVLIQQLVLGHSVKRACAASRRAVERGINTQSGRESDEARESIMSPDVRTASATRDPDLGRAEAACGDSALPHAGSQPTQADWAAPAQQLLASLRPVRLRDVGVHPLVGPDGAADPAATPAEASVTQCTRMPSRLNRLVRNGLSKPIPVVHRIVVLPHRILDPILFVSSHQGTYLASSIIG